MLGGQYEYGFNTYQSDGNPYGGDAVFDVSFGAVFRNAHEPAGEGGKDSCGICIRACGIYSGADPARKENTPREYGGELKECGRVGEFKTATKQPAKNT